jgi:hypothetical protein
MMLFCTTLFASTVALAVVAAPIATADPVAYLVNVAVRRATAFLMPTLHCPMGWGSVRRSPPVAAMQTSFTRSAASSPHPTSIKPRI